MRKYILAVSLTTLTIFALTSSALAASQTSALKPGGRVAGGVVTSSAKFSGSKVAVTVRGEVTMKRTGRIKVTSQACQNSTGQCQGVTKTRRITIKRGKRKFVTSASLSRGQRAIISVRSGNRLLLLHDITEPSQSDEEDSSNDNSDSGDNPTPTNPTQPTPEPPVVSSICTEYLFDAQLGYESCVHWKSTAAIAPSSIITSGSITFEAWRTGPTWESVGNRVYARMSGNITTNQATFVDLAISPCGLPNFAVCAEQQSVQKVNLAAGANTIDYSNSFVLTRPPTTVAFAVISSAGTSAFGNYHKLRGCRAANIPVCATPVAQ